jgi:hypothetical protein
MAAFGTNSYRQVGGRSCHAPRRFGPLFFKRTIRLLIGAAVLSSLVACAQTSDSQSASKSWRETTDSQNDNANPTRTSESHVQSGNRTVDTQSVERRGADGNFEPYQDIEKSTVQVDSNTLRTTTRTFGRDSDGAKTLVQMTEEETRTRLGGGSSLVRSTSNPDANGNLQLVQREIQETKKTGKDSEETKTTVMLPGSNGGLVPAMMVDEVRRLGANDTGDARKTTLLPDGNGNWQVSEVQKSVTRQDGKDRSTETLVSRPDADGKLGEVSRKVTHELQGAGEKRSTVEDYSLDVPGVARDGNLHMVERATTVQSASSAGRQSTRRQIEQTNPGDPDAGLQVTVVDTNIVRTGASGTQATQTIQMLDANGSLGVVSVDTTKGNNPQAIQVQIAPAEKSK